MNNFRYFNNDQLSLKRGWKIHLSPYLNEVDEVEKIFVNWVNLYDKKLAYKIMDKNLYQKFLFPYKREISSQIGKYITIYPRDEQHFLEILEKLFFLFRDRKGITPISDRQYKESSFINYRYGQITQNKKSAYKGNMTFRLPKGIKDNTGYNPQPFLQEFKFYKMVRDTNYGSIFIVLDKEKNKYIVKDGREGVGMRGDITSAFMRQYEWEVLNKIDVGPQPVKKETYLDHNFYVYKYLNFTKKLNLACYRDEFIKFYNEWTRAINHFKKEILSKIAIYDYNIHNFAILNNKIIILDGKFIAPKNKHTYIDNILLSGPIKNWKDLPKAKRTKTLFMLLLTGLYPESAIGINYKTLAYIYKNKLESFKLKDPLDIKISFDQEAIYKPSFARIKNKIKKQDIELVKQNWQNNLNKKYMNLIIKKGNQKYESPWLDEGTLNLIYWTIVFHKRRELNLFDYSQNIKKFFEFPAITNTFKTTKLGGLRGFLYVWKILPAQIKKDIAFDIKKIQKTITELESLIKN